ncbi:MAG: hypothetical protein PHX20_03315 [Candidatus Omnitrophica bacterium]|nr:hypothetical protein [Candidatus Omnitrophota bacterium]
MTKIPAIQFIFLVCALISALWAAIQIFRFLLSRIKKTGEAFKLTLIISVLNILGAISIIQFAHKFITFPRNFIFVFSVLMILTAFSILVFAKGLVVFLKGSSKENAFDNKIKSLETIDRDKTKDFAEKEKTFLKRISDLETKNIELDRKSRIMDEVPDGFWFLHGKVLYDKENGTYYCWNCWNKLVGRERRVLDGDEYYVSCKVCGVGAQLKEYPRPPAAPEEPLY